jgi:hypothetical protein
MHDQRITLVETQHAELRHVPERSFENAQAAAARAAEFRVLGDTGDQFLGAFGPAKPFGQKLMELSIIHWGFPRGLEVVFSLYRISGPGRQNGRAGLTGYEQH